MIKIENDCVDCGLPCVDFCKYKRVPHYYCDKCGYEANELFDTDAGQLCMECAKELITDEDIEELVRSLYKTVDVEAD